MKNKEFGLRLIFLELSCIHHTKEFKVVSIYENLNQVLWGCWCRRSKQIIKDSHILVSVTFKQNSNAKVARLVNTTSYYLAPRIEAHHCPSAPLS